MTNLTVNGVLAVGNDSNSVMSVNAAANFAGPAVFSNTVVVSADMAFDGDMAIGAGANASYHGVAVGNGATGSLDGVVVGIGADGGAFGAALGNSACGALYGAAIGIGADGSHHGVAVGANSLGYEEGTAIGANSWGYLSGAAVGEWADGTSQGAAVGHVANGSYGGAAVGSEAMAVNGVAVGNFADGTCQGAALGQYANGSTNGVAVGAFAHAVGPGTVALGGDYGCNPASVRDGWLDTVELGRGTANLEGGLNFRGHGIVDSNGVLVASINVATGATGTFDTVQVGAGGLSTGSNSDLTVGGALSVARASNIRGDLIVGGALWVEGTGTFTHACTFMDSVTFVSEHVRVPDACQNDGLEAVNWQTLVYKLRNYVLLDELDARIGTFGYLANETATLQTVMDRGNTSTKSLIIGTGTAYSGGGSASFGNGTASGSKSVAEGNSTAEGQFSHAEGEAFATGFASHAEGDWTHAVGTASHAAGCKANAINDNTYVWSDGTSVSSTLNQQYTVYAMNGTRLLGGQTEIQSTCVHGAARFESGIVYTAALGDISMGTFTNQVTP